MTGMRYHSAEVADVDRYITDDSWAMEQKLDGIRCIATVDADGHVTFTGHAGNPLRSSMKHHAPIAAELGTLRSIVVDGELMADGHLWLFDILAFADTNLRTFPFETRRALLAQLDDVFDLVHVVPSATDVAAKTTLWAMVQATNGEGVVVKRLAGTYSATGRSRDVLKIKVTKTIDVIVIGFGSGTDSAVLGLHRDGTLVEMGKCSLLGKPPVEIGDVIEVRYLYVVESDTPRLYQPRMLRVRPDKSPVECGWEQLDGATTSKLVVAA